MARRCHCDRDVIVFGCAPGCDGIVAPETALKWVPKARGAESGFNANSEQWVYDVDAGVPIPFGTGESGWVSGTCGTEAPRPAAVARSTARRWRRR